MNLTPHFSLAEMTASELAARRGLDNTPGEAEIANLRRLASFLEQLRSILQKPIIVNSAYRSPAVNAAVGGKPTSQHCLGLAADIRVPGMTPDEVVRRVRSSGLPFDQVIREFDTWTHVSVAPAGTQPRHMALIIDREGTRAFA